MMWTLDTFYKSKEWLRFRDIIVQQRTNKDDGLLYCEHCGKPIVKAYDIIIHHKVELTDSNVNDRSISLHQDNVICVHHNCHNIIHARFGYEKMKQVFIVYGPPFSGKSSYVKSIARPTDLIIDIDRIWECISNNEPYIKPDRLKQNVFAVRDCLIEQAKNRKGKWTDCYLIGGYPYHSELRQLEDRLNASAIFIDEPYEVCVERLYQSNDGRDKELWKKYIDDWFFKFNCNPPD